MVSSAFTRDPTRYQTGDDRRDRVVDLLHWGWPTHSGMGADGTVERVGEVAQRLLLGQA